MTAAAQPRLSLSNGLLWTVLVLFILAWLYALGMRTLVPTDEGRYAEMAREMLASGDWITPRLNGIKYFEKPPLQTWFNAATFAVFGLGEWQARLWTGLSALLAVGLVGYTGRKLYGARVGLYAMLMLGSCFMWVGLGHINTLDMGLSGMMSVALCALLLAQRDEATSIERRRWMLACYAGMAFAVLSKGLIGVVLPGAVLVLYTMASRDLSIWKRLNLLPGLVVFFAICTPWFVLVSQKNPEFPHFFFIHEHVERFLTKVHKREGAWYYFIPLLIIGLMPWLGLLPQGIKAAWHKPAPGEPVVVFRAPLLLAIWAGFIFFFFSYSSSKLPSYILPIFPALALLFALALDKDQGRGFRASALILVFVAVFGLIMAPKTALFSRHPLETPFILGYQPWIIAACILALAGALFSLFLHVRQQKDGAILSLALTGFACWLLLLAGSEAHGRYRAGLSLMPAFERELTPATSLYAVGMYDQTLPFYLRRTMTLVEHMDELEFGLKQQPELWIRSGDAFKETWQNGPPAIAIMSPEKFVELSEQHLRLRVLAQDSRRIVVSNQMVPARHRRQP